MKRSCGTAEDFQSFFLRMKSAFFAEFLRSIIAVMVLTAGTWKQYKHPN